MIRDLTMDFLPRQTLEYSVKVFHGKIQPDINIQKEAIIFILNPEKLSQQELRLLFQYNACFVFFKADPMTEISAEQHPIKLLLSDKEANNHLKRIKGLQKNILKLHIEKNKWWDFLGITVSYKQLFSIKDLGFCFMEYPVISEETLNLDDVFLQEAVKSVNPIDAISRYLEIIEKSSSTSLEAINRRNAFQKVFKFYQSQINDYEFNLDSKNVSFLVDVLRLDEFHGDSVQKAIIIGALTAACSYFIHAGHPESYHIIMKKLLMISEENQNTIKYKHISQADLNLQKNRNAFLYYHLTCRIPNQYTIALFDMFLVEADAILQQKYEVTIDVWIEYLKKQVSELLVMPESFLWEFKRDQEIGAMAGTIGQIILYKQVAMKGDLSAFDEAERYFKMAIEYAHPAEKSRDINYLIQCRLSRIIHLYFSERKLKNSAEELQKLATLISERFLDKEHYNAFDMMFAICIIAVSNITLSDKNSEAIYNILGFDLNKIGIVMNKSPYQYAVYLLVGYLLFVPKKLIDSISDMNILLQRTICFFKLDDDEYQSKSVIDLIGLKFMLAHGWYLSNYGNEKDKERLKAYKKRIENSCIFSKWRYSCSSYMDECILQTASADKALKLIYTIPY